MEVWIELRELSRGQQEAVVTSGSSRARGEKQFCRIQRELKSGQRSCLAGTKVIEDSGQRCWSKEEEIFWLLSSHPLIFLPVTPIYQTQRKPEGKGAQMKWSIRLSPKSRMCVCVCVCAKSPKSCPTLHNPMDCSPPASSVHGDSPGKNTGVGCHVLLQGIFPTQGLNPGLSCICMQILYH